MHADQRPPPLMPRFLVVVLPPKNPPQHALGNPSLSSSMVAPTAPVVRVIVAKTRPEAIGHVEVPPGGSVMVAYEGDVERYERPVRAALEPRDIDGGHLPDEVL